jgi:hypothetical protein
LQELQLPRLLTAHQSIFNSQNFTKPAAEEELWRLPDRDAPDFCQELFDCVDNVDNVDNVYKTADESGWVLAAKACQGLVVILFMPQT